MKYPFSVYKTQSGEHAFWAAESPCLKGCVAQGETMEEACAQLEENERVWLETAEEYGIEIPPVPVEPLAIHSGKFTVRVAPYVHKAAAEMAKKQGVSLNQYVSDAIVAQNSALAVEGYISPEIKRMAASLRELMFESPATRSEGSGKAEIVYLSSDPKYKISENRLVQ